MNKPRRAEPDLTRLREVFLSERGRHHQTYEELADATGLARQTLLNIASGKYHGDLRTWLLLAKTWGVTLDTLLAPVWTSDQSGST
ncbi:helix-turn-helix transcriptional regulator [Luteipulveratus halotolerans]|uniref:helix-turn-helix transcriptional regulator n=1 Tax=Luteipulveratus halotolerans TaxID=1631356 RepID=UPI001E58A98F|nr:helix-turn-helix domain-containing protein [Luteipulveratus halotolerans]